MKTRYLSTFIGIICTILLVNISANISYAEEIDCPNNWKLELVNKNESDSYPGFSPSIYEKTGTLEKKKIDLGRNIDIVETKQYSNDSNIWKIYEFPIKTNYGDLIGPAAIEELSNGFIRVVYTIYVKGCSQPGIFNSPALKFPPINLIKGNFDIEDTIDPRIWNFRQAEEMAKQLRSGLTNMQNNFLTNQYFPDRIPEDDSKLYITPKIRGCMTWNKGKWMSNGKSCVMYVYSTNIYNLPKLQSTKADTPSPFNRFYITEFTLPAISKYSPNIKSTILCSNGKLTKKVSGVNPLCPKGYKIKK